MEIKINNNVIHRLRREGFYPDTMLSAYFTLKSLYENEIELLDAADDGASSKRIILVYYDLVRKGLLEEAQEGKLIFKFTDRGMQLIKELIEMTEPPKKKTETEVEHWIDEWMELWPRGLKSGGKLVRSDTKGCLAKLKKFIKDYPNITKETIFEATSRYLSEQERKGWAYTKCATYFIHKKDEGSELAARCEQLKETAPQPHQSEFFV